MQRGTLQQIHLITLHSIVECMQIAIFEELRHQTLYKLIFVSFVKLLAMAVDLTPHMSLPQLRLLSERPLQVLPQSPNPL